MRICVIGAGYVGLVSAACFAEMGNRVVCVERDPQRVARLARGQSPIYEPGLEVMLQTHLSSGQLSFSQHLHADSTPSGHSAHVYPDTCSTVIRTGSRSVATQVSHC